MKLLIYTLEVLPKLCPLAEARLSVPGLDLDLDGPWLEASLFRQLSHLSKEPNDHDYSVDTEQQNRDPDPDLSSQASLIRSAVAGLSSWKMALAPEATRAALIAS